jgi:O-antigen/teichoic acid export membrane protein
MIRRILGFAVMAIVALLVLKIALGLLGVLIGLTVSVLVLAGMGYVFYLVLRFFSPSTAERIRQVIRGTTRTTTG